MIYEFRLCHETLSFWQKWFSVFRFVSLNIKNGTHIHTVPSIFSFDPLLSTHGRHTQLLLLLLMLLWIRYGVPNTVIWTSFCNKSNTSRKHFLSLHILVRFFSQKFFFYKKFKRKMFPTKNTVESRPKRIIHMQNHRLILNLQEYRKNCWNYTSFHKSNFDHEFKDFFSPFPPNRNLIIFKSFIFVCDGNEKLARKIDCIEQNENVSNEKSYNSWIIRFVDQKNTKQIKTVTTF